MRLKDLVRYPLDIRRAERLLSSRLHDSSSLLSERPIVLDLRTTQLLFDCGRHLACIVQHASLAGSRLIIRCSRAILAGIARKPYGRQALSNPATSWLPPDASVPNHAIVLCDDDHRDQNDSLWMMIGRDFDEGSVVMPYPMHPNTLLQASDMLLDRLRANRSRRGIFFAGNQKTKYDNAQLEQQFGVISRPRLLHTVSNYFSSRVVSSIQQSDHRTPIVLRDVRTDPIAPQDWLPALSQATFFLACPGASQPICHNVVEAMSVGTIPIIEYGDRMHPKLTDGINAICFQGETGLCEAITRIDRLSADQLTTMHQNVIDYYDEHLRGDQFLANVRDGRLQPADRKLWMPFHHENFFAAENRHHRKRAA